MGRVSAYFVFTRQAREEVKESLLESGAKAGVTDVAKALGVRWRALSEEERAAFKQRAEQEAAAAAAADPEGGAYAAGDGGDGASAPQPPISQLPLARVGRIMKMDKEVGRYSKEALLLTAVATEAFLSGLTDHAAAAAKSAGRRTIKINDVAEVCARRENDRLHFLVDVMKSMAGEVAEAAAVANASKPGRRAPSDGAEGERVGDGEEGGEPATGADKSKRGKKVDRAPTLPKMKSMTDFFTKHRGPAPPPPERTSEDDEEDDFAAYEGATDDEEVRSRVPDACLHGRAWRTPILSFTRAPARADFRARAAWPPPGGGARFGRIVHSLAHTRCGDKTAGGRRFRGR